MLSQTVCVGGGTGRGAVGAASPSRKGFELHSSISRRSLLLSLLHPLDRAVKFSSFPVQSGAQDNSPCPRRQSNSDRTFVEICGQAVQNYHPERLRKKSGLKSSKSCSHVPARV